MRYFGLKKSFQAKNFNKNIIKNRNSNAQMKE